MPLPVAENFSAWGLFKVWGVYLADSAFSNVDRAAFRAAFTPIRGRAQGLARNRLYSPPRETKEHVFASIVTSHELKQGTVSPSQPNNVCGYGFINISVTRTIDAGSVHKAFVSNDLKAPARAHLGFGKYGEKASSTFSGATIAT